LFKPAIRRPKALRSCVGRVQPEGPRQFDTKDAVRCASINARGKAHAVFASLQYDRNRDAFLIIHIGAIVADGGSPPFLFGSGPRTLNAFDDHLPTKCARQFIEPICALVPCDGIAH
jgi:hypothetical protein